MHLGIEGDYKQRVRNWLSSFPNDAPVVVVPVFNAYDDVLECLESILAMTRPGTPILVLDDASSDDRIAGTLEPLAHRRGFTYIRMTVNAGFVRTVNAAFEWCAPHDVVVVNSDVIVPAEWLERLQAAACFRSNIATATPFTNHGTLVSLPYRNKPVPDLVDGMALSEIDSRIRESSIPLRPIIPTAVGHCTYFRRSALDTIGYFSEVFSPGYGEEVDFSQRAVAAGLCHVLADDLFVFHKGSRSFGQDSAYRRRLQESHDRLIQERYPWYMAWMVRAANDPYSPLAHAVERASAALLGYRIAVDATCVNGVTTGTQVLTLELIRALATSPHRHGHLAVIIGDAASKDMLLGVDGLVDEVISVSRLKQAELPLFDLVHRPFQVVTANDLNLLQSVARRFIVSHLDCISYANPSYALSETEWARYRRHTEYVFAAADGIAFISKDAAQDAAHQGLHVPEERMCVTYVGVNHHLHMAVEALPPPRSDSLMDEPYLLVIGTNFKHKNRVYAIRLLRVLIEKHGWSGRLVLAGPNVASGGSSAEEALERSRSPDLQHRIQYIGWISEGEKKWLLQHAAVVLYPTIYEGFGIIPFEAAAAGTPALMFHSTSLTEVLGEDVVYLETLNPEMGAEVVWSVLSNPECARRQVEAILARSPMFPWGGIADRTWEFYRRVLQMPPRLAGVKSYLQDVAESGKGPPGLGQFARAWVRRITLGFRILGRDGWGALQKEIRQYIQWRRAQF